MLVGHMMICSGSTIPHPQYAKLFINPVRAMNIITISISRSPGALI
jgi:hypothetical protein